MELRKKHIGENHFLIAEVLEDFANLKLKRGDGEENIQESLIRAMNMRKAILKQHKMPETAINCLEVAKSFARQNNTIKALQFY
jgi:hypothetical protein